MATYIHGKCQFLSRLNKLQRGPLFVATTAGGVMLLHWSKPWQTATKKPISLIASALCYASTKESISKEKCIPKTPHRNAFLKLLSKWYRWRSSHFSFKKRFGLSFTLLNEEMIRHLLLSNALLGPSSSTLPASASRERWCSKKHFSAQTSTPNWEMASWTSGLS